MGATAKARNLSEHVPFDVCADRDVQSYCRVESAHAFAHVFPMCWSMLLLAPGTSERILMSEAVAKARNSSEHVPCNRCVDRASEPL